MNEYKKMFGRSSRKDKVLGFFHFRELVMYSNVLSVAVAVRAMMERRLLMQLIWSNCFENPFPFHIMLFSANSKGNIIHCDQVWLFN